MAVRTAKQKAALRKAQLASARKRKGHGTSRKRTIVRRGAKAAAVGVAAYHAGKLYKNREKRVIAPLAEHNAVLQARREGVSNRHSLARVRLQERKDHASRSSYRVREYKTARKFYRNASRSGQTLKPGHKNNPLQKTGASKYIQSYIHTTYAKDRHARATHRLNKIKGKKVTGFSYKSGKVRGKFRGRVVRYPF